MRQFESSDLSTLPSWILAILTGCALAYFYTLIVSSIEINGDFLVLQFSNVNKPEDNLMLLYLGYFLMGVLGSVITAFTTVYIPSFFFQQSPMKFGALAGVVAIFLLVCIFVFGNEDTFPGIWGRRPWFLLIEFINWMTLIGASGVVSILGQKTREKFLALFREIALK